MTDEDEFEELVPDAGADSGPFSVESVDPLVYTMDETSPELRAAAAYIPVAPKLTIRDAAPTPPMERKHEIWTPGGEISKPIKEGSGNSPIARAIKSLTTFIIIMLPMVVIAGVVWLAWSAYSK